MAMIRPGGGHNIVEELLFDITFDDEQLAFQQQAGLSSFVGETLKEIIDEVMCQCSSPDTVFRIDRLEIDLGNLAYEDYQFEVIRKFKGLFASTLQERLAEAGRENGSKGRLITSAENDFELLTHFLEHGYFPWHSHGEGAASIEALLHRVLESDARQFVDFMRRTRMLNNVIKRLSSLFSAGLIDRLLAGIEVGASSAVATSVNLLRRLFLPYGGGTLFRSFPEHFVRSCLLELLLAPSGIADQKSAFHHIMTQLASASGVDSATFYERVITFIEHLVKEGDFSQTQVSMVLAVIIELAPSGSMWDITGMTPENRTAIAGLIAEVLLGGAVHSIAGIWSTLVHDEDELLRKTIRRYGVETVVRRRMATTFPDPMLKDVVCLFEPVEHHFVEELVERPELFREAARKYQEEAGTIKAQLWEFALTYILVERGSEFNRQAFMGSVIRQMAAYANISHHQLVRSLHDALAGLESDTQLKEQLLGLLQSISNNEGIEIDNSARFDEAETATADPPAALQMFINSLLSGDYSRLEVLWPKLLHADPNTIKHAFSRVGVPDLLRRAFFKTHNESGLRDLLLVLKPEEQPLWDDFLTQFMPLLARILPSSTSLDFIQKAAWEWTLTSLLLDQNTAFNRAAYLEGIIGYMADLAGVHHDSLLRSMHEFAVAGKISGALEADLTHLFDLVAPEGERWREDATRNREWVNLKRKFRNDRLAVALKSGDAYMLHGIWPELLLDEQEYLKNTIQSLGTDPLVRRKIARGFPETLLMDILYLFEPLEGGFIEELIIHPEAFNSPRQSNSQQDMDVTRRLLWEFTFSHLLVDRGSEFNRKSYLKSMVKDMAAHGSMHFHELIRSFQQALSEFDSWSGLRTDILALINEVAEDEGIEASDFVNHPSGNGKMIRCYSMYAQLRSRFTGSSRETWRTGGEEELARLTDELAKEHPAQFLLLLYEIVAATGLITRDSTVSNNELLIVLRAYFSAVQPGVDFSAFFDALLRQMNKPGSVKPVFSTLLEHLLTLTAVNSDPASLLRDNIFFPDGTAETAAVMPSEHMSATDVREPEPVVSLPLALQTSGDDNRDNPAEPGTQRVVNEQILVSCMTGDRTLHATEADDFRYTVAHMLIHSPMQLRLLIEKLLTGHSAAARMVSLLSEDLLSKLLHLLQPTNSDLVSLLRGHMFFSDGTAEATTVSGDDSRDNPAESGAQHVVNEQILISCMTDDRTLHATDADDFRHTVAHMLTHSPMQLRRLIEKHLTGHSAAARMVSLLPEDLLSQLLFLMQPTNYYRFQQLSDTMAHAVHGIKSYNDPSRIRYLKWEFILEFFTQGGSPEERRFVQEFSGFLSRHGGYETVDEFSTVLCRQIALASQYIPFATSEKIVTLLKGNNREELPRNAPVTLPERLLFEEKALPEFDDSMPIYILNAGQVIASAYLPQLFNMLGMLENGTFADEQKAERAMHLVQYMVDGRCDAPEHELVLNKILCGIAPETPVARSIEITEQEREVVESLLSGMISNWTVLGGTSIKGFQESFLQREGRLCMKEDVWNLLVQPKAYDMLLDRLPWSYAIVKHKWMDNPVYVEWSHGL
jgi:hypothetical protein